VTGNAFEPLFADHRYVRLKQDLYNYRLRRRAVGKALDRNGAGPILEVGSGLSPTVSGFQEPILTDLSFAALQILRRQDPHGRFVATDATRLPFKTGVFAQVVCSEVIEHLADDRGALAEMARVLQPSGTLVVTFPHRRRYFAIDDRCVGHHRRYELAEMRTLLEEAGLHLQLVWKVLGPLDKITMVSLFGWLLLRQRWFPRRTSAPRPLPVSLILLFRWVNRVQGLFAWLEATLIPRSLATVLLIKAVRATTRKGGPP
jgi:SAM-dependent methyltransferase